MRELTLTVLYDLFGRMCIHWVGHDMYAAFDVRKYGNSEAYHLESGTYVSSKKQYYTWEVHAALALDLDIPQFPPPVRSR